MFIPPIYLKLYLNKIGNGEKIYNKFAYIISYIIPISLGTFLVLIIAGAGGRFVFGHSLFDNVGLGFLIPDSFNYLTYTSNFKLDFISEILFSLQGIIILSFLLIILLGFPFYKEKSERIKKSV